MRFGFLLFKKGAFSKKSKFFDKLHLSEIFFQEAFVIILEKFSDRYF
jgi:hypothetical protein